MQNIFSIKLKKLFTIVSLSLIPALSHGEPATAESIHEYFKISGQEVAAKENFAKLLPRIRQATNMPEELLAELSRTDNLVDKFIPTYQKYLTEQDIQDLIAFYKTPAGVKFAKIYSKMEEEIMLKIMLETQITVMNFYIQKGKFTVEKK